MGKRTASVKVDGPITLAHQGLAAHNWRAESPNPTGTPDQPMPTLFRFLYWCALIAGVIYAILFALAYLVEPTPRDATIEIPSERTNPPPQ